MRNTVIRVEDVSKQYRLGKIGTGTFAHDFNRWWHKIRGKEDPYLKLGEENDRTVKGLSDYVWALSGISFDVEQGDVIGIIGRNGAGKSTLLKLLSRTTLPTSGSIKIRGRIASLLEVGTGFHPELTGKENIFLNGAILGMRKYEIRDKFDAIVEFSGVEKYIDTPVKRYSSGMYVRLAFAVAAHLDPEILIVDEVLAVGDAEFQRKALGKMQDVSKGEGRTVLFVSHNMSAITQLCKRGILLNKGKIAALGDIFSVTAEYRNLGVAANTDLSNFENREGNGLCRVLNVQLLTDDQKLQSTISLGDIISINIEIRNFSDRPVNNIRIVIGIYNALEEGYLRFDTKNSNEKLSIEKETLFLQCQIMEHINIKPDNYYINVAIFEGNILLDYVVRAYKFSVENFDYFGTGRNIENSELSKVFYKHVWHERK